MNIALFWNPCVNFIFTLDNLLAIEGLIETTENWYRVTTSDFEIDFHYLAKKKFKFNHTKKFPLMIFKRGKIELFSDLKMYCLNNIIYTNFIS